MVLLYLNGALQLDDPSDLKKSVFELSDTRNFSHILDRSESDVHKYAVMFNVDLDPTKTYYARARCLLTTGWTHYVNLDIVTVKLSGLSGYKNSILPSRISTPIINTNSIQDKHDITNFNIYASGFTRVGLSTHNKTICFITDSNNEVVWYKISDINLYTIEFDNSILLENEIYKINVIFGSSSNDFSQIASMTIVTGGNSNINLISSKDILLNNDFKIKVEKRFNITSIDGILTKLQNQSKKVLEFTTTNFEYIVDKSNITEGMYLLQLKSNLDNNYKNYILQTEYQNGDNEGLDLTIGANDNLFIEDLSLYSSITIKPGGKIRIMINGEEVEFGSDTLIVPYAMEISSTTLENGKYSSILYTDDSSVLTITN